MAEAGDSKIINGSESISLADILDNEAEEIGSRKLFAMEDEHVDDDENALPAKPGAEGFCVECEGTLFLPRSTLPEILSAPYDQPAELLCETCADTYCSVCYHSQHRKGNRKRHVTKSLNEGPPRKRQKHEDAAHPKDVRMTAPQLSQNSDMDVVPETQSDVLNAVEDDIEDDDGSEKGGELGRIIKPEPSRIDDYVHRAKFIPLRLTLMERKYLRLLEAALTVSEYTDKVDILLPYGKSKVKRMVAQIKEICAVLSGLLLAADYKAGQGLFENRDFAQNEAFFQQVFELGRRHKIMNPDKMRTTYGKLVYLLMDTQKPEVKDMLGFSAVSPIRTVYETLERGGALDLLKEDLIRTATQEIHSEGRSRREIQSDIKAKERAIERLSAKYARLSELDEGTIKQCVYSIGDNSAFLRVNRDPCDQLIGWLIKYFHPTQATPGCNLSIRYGRGGARLTHGHAQQYSYCLQSLTLWREILGDMFELWHLAESDLLSDDAGYRLRDTGQGFNRIQPAPKTSRKMHAILHRAQSSVGYWVGSSVIHMGDHNVPNAHFFLDKYTQVYRICLPICNVLNHIPVVMAKPTLAKYIETEFGSMDDLYKEILGDFFRHAFDGSGADNFFDAGSCIDGRLTSAWEWCSKIEKKKYWHVFQLCGFHSFDGDW